MNDRKNKKREEDPGRYNTIDDIDDYLRGVMAADAFRVMTFIGKG